MRLNLKRYLGCLSLSTRRNGLRIFTLENREGAADKKDKKRKEFIAYLEDNSDWKQFHLSGKKAEEQEPNNAAQDHTKEVANELIDGGDIDPSALEAAQDIISEGSGINHGEPVEIVPGTENDVGRGDNVRVLKFDKEDSAQTPEERREIVQASLTDHAEKVATVVELPDGRFLVKFNAGTSDADVDNVVSLHGLEPYSPKRMAAKGNVNDPVPAKSSAPTKEKSDEPPSNVEIDYSKLPRRFNTEEFKSKSWEERHELLVKEEKRLNEKFFEHEARGNARLARKYQRQIFALDDVLEDMYEEGGSKSTEGSGDDRFKGASDKRLNEIIGELEKKGGFEDEVQNIKDELERRTPTEAATDEAAAATDEAAAATDEAAATTDEAENLFVTLKSQERLFVS